MEKQLLTQTDQELIRQEVKSRANSLRLDIRTTAGTPGMIAICGYIAYQIQQIAVPFLEQNIELSREEALINLISMILLGITVTKFTDWLVEKLTEDEIVRLNQEGKFDLADALVGEFEYNKLLRANSK